jgi:hypothetical protein
MARQYDLKGYNFTRRWFFNRNYETFVKHVMPAWRGKSCTYLEIGVFEAQSLCWMLEHVLTAKDSYAVGIDPWLMTTKLSGEQMKQVMLRANYNIFQAVHSKPPREWPLVRGHSAEVLRRMNKKGFAGISKGSVDVAMIDGNHWAPYVLDDAEQCLSLVKPGGWLMFDDVENDIEKKDHVKQGLAMFVEKHGDVVEEIWRHRYMVCLKRK